MRTSIAVRITISLLLVGLLGGCFFGKPKLAPLGPVKMDSLCGDLARCDARGDVAVSALKGRKPAPIHLADGQGVESYLGKVAPERSAQGVLKTCGGDVSRDDWLETGPAVRVLELPPEGKQHLRESLKASIARGLLARQRDLATDELDVEAASEAAVRQVGLPRISMISQTYWLKDSAFERRVGQCGEEEYTNIIYSLTLLQLSELTRKDLESKLVAGLESKLVVEKAPESATPPAEDAVPAGELTAQPAVAEGAAVPVPPDASEARKKLLRELGFDAVRELAGTLRMIAALGFDET